jgi:hypothetical protein
MSDDFGYPFGLLRSRTLPARRDAVGFDYFIGFGFSITSGSKTTSIGLSKLWAT